MIKKEFHIRGRVIDSVTQQGISGLSVEVWDKDLICDDFLGQVVSDNQGAFSLSFSTASFSKPDPGDLFDFLDFKPDVYFKVYEGKQILAITDVMPNLSEQTTEVTIEVSRGGDGEVEKERKQFKALLLTNPNYFGNLPESQFQAVKQIKGNTSYEEIGCVGFQPQREQLEAVVYIKRPNGYGGEICSDGTPEYVRFYLSYDNGTTWQDQGVTSFTAYDIPGVGTNIKRLEYAVTLNVNLQEKPCKYDNLILARAILSWNLEPPPDTPDYPPIWGNVHNTYIQVDKLELAPLQDFLAVVGEKLPPTLADTLDLSQVVTTVAPKKLSLKELQESYQGKVEPLRLVFTEVQQHLAKQGANPSLKASELSALGLDLSELSVKLFPVDGDTRYEELECIGLNPNLDKLVGIIRVKLPTGYLGPLCSAGSKEYVTFWADFDNNGTFETCLGTTSVNAYDFRDIPKEGLEYAVSLPVDLTKYRQPCQKGPKLVRIRAILSWQTPAPCWNPNYIPVWGNREETIIHIKPGKPIPPDTHPPVISTVGGMAVTNINATTGLANGPAETAGFTADDSPFGGLVIIGGHIAYPPDISEGATKLKYKVEVSNDGGTIWQPLTNTFNLKLDVLLNGIWTPSQVTQSVDSDNWYEYQEDTETSPPATNEGIYPIGNVLARWYAGGLTGLWKIRVRVKDPSLSPSPIWTSDVVTVRLDSDAPKASITITSGGGPCADFNVGTPISGTYSATDEHFGKLQLTVLPALGGGSFTTPLPLPPGATMPLVRTYSGGVSGTGESGNWKLDTKGMPKCGYVVELSVWDRTIVNSGSLGRYNRDLVGFCLRESNS